MLENLKTGLGRLLFGFRDVLAWISSLQEKILRVVRIPLPFSDFNKRIARDFFSYIPDTNGPISSFAQLVAFGVHNVDFS